jgi:hypothetical protein
VLCLFVVQRKLSISRFKPNWLDFVRRAVGGNLEIFYDKPIWLVTVPHFDLRKPLGFVTHNISVRPRFNEDFLGNLLDLRSRLKQRLTKTGRNRKENSPEHESCAQLGECFAARLWVSQVFDGRRIFHLIFVR